jgi:hypothetical protein
MKVASVLHVHSTQYANPIKVRGRGANSEECTEFYVPPFHSNDCHHRPVISALTQTTIITQMNYIPRRNRQFW